MDIYSYAGFAYGLTALISLGTIGLILLIILGIPSLAISAIGGILGGWVIYWFSRLR